MDQKPKNNEIKIELPPEVANGRYANLTFISHGPTEVFIDFIAMAPNMPQAKVQSRIIMTPENAKNLLFTLHDNIQKYEKTFGEIKRTVPLNQPKNGGANPGENPNPFMMGGNA